MSKKMSQAKRNNLKTIWSNLDANQLDVKRKHAEQKIMEAMLALNRRKVLSANGKM